MTEERRLAALNTPPVDEADAEIVRALHEGRSIVPEIAFPEPPPSIEQQVADGAIRPPEDARDEMLSEVQPVANEVLTRRRARSSIAPTEPEPPEMPDPNQGPAERLANVAQNASAYLTEYRLKLLHRMLMRNLPVDMIAAQLKLSVPAVNQMRVELQRRLAYEAQTINRYEIAGKTMAFYDEIQGLALRMADEAGSKPYVKLQALQTALGAQSDRQRFLTASGFWSNAPYVPMDAKEDESSRAANKLQALIEAIVDDKGEMHIESIGTTESSNQSDMDGTVKLL
jgi:hypothetical protein